jgi:phage terminase large subunit GpA-like protein
VAADTGIAAVLPRPLPLQPEELEVLEPRERMSCSEWAPRRYVLSEKTAELPGPWSHDVAPFQVEIMDCLSDAGTRQVTVSKCTQAGGTEVGNIFVGRSVEEAPGPLLLVMPREEDVRRRVDTRLRPMFEKCPSLLRHLGGKADNLNIGKETVLDNMILYLAWSTSPAALADNPCCYIILDEVGKYPAASGREADPVSLAKKRLRTFRTRSKLYVLSSPVVEGDLIDREYRRGDQRQWWFRCPCCGAYQSVAWADVDLDKDGDGHLLEEGVYRSGGHARIICRSCKAGWNEQQRWLAVCGGRWVPAGCQLDRSGRLIGHVPATTHASFHITAWMLNPMFVSIDELAAEFAAARAAQKAGDIGPMQDFWNSQAAEPMRVSEKRTDENKLRDHIDEGINRGQVPPAVQILTAGLDVQLDHVYAVVMGYGYLSEVFLIHEARLETGDTRQLDNYELVKGLLGMPFFRTTPAGQTPAAEGTVDAATRRPALHIRKAAIDFNYRSDTVLDFCRSVRNQYDVVPVRGDPTVKGVMYRTSKYPDGLVHFNLGVNALKGRLWRLMDNGQKGPGYLHLHGQSDDELLSQLTSEEEVTDPKTKQRGWRKRPGRSAQPNHYWDCCVYADFAAELSGARMLRDPSVPMPARRPPAVMNRFRR